MNRSAHDGCPLCGNIDNGLYFQDQQRCYWQCDCCQLVFVNPEQRLTAIAEKKQYDLHQNDVNDKNYRRFLSRLSDPLLQRLKTANHGLDFGCGPGPALADIFQQQGHTVNLYDFFYFNNKCVLQQPYGFIAATEVVEHLFYPGEVLQQLWKLLVDGGVLGLMTKLLIDKEAFSRWHYKNDPTHVCFFSRQSFVWLAGQLQAELEFVGKDVIFLTKSDSLLLPH